MLSLKRMILFEDGSDQLNEDRAKGVEQSDPSIAVRDGRADHRRCKGSVHLSWRREGQGDKVSKALTAWKECPRLRRSSLLAKGS